MNIRKPFISRFFYYHEKRDIKYQPSYVGIQKLDQYQYLGNCPPTPPLTQH